MPTLLRVSLGTIVVFLLAELAWAQPGSIKGTILDSNGEPIPFANITVQGTRAGAAADVSGAFQLLNVPPGQYRLVASAVGYRRSTASVSVSPGAEVTQDFTLVEDPLGLEQVTVTGSYTPKSKLEATVAISTLTPREIALANPRSTTEVLRYTPGFTRVESSGGEVNQNISVRGVLGVEYVMFMEDGLPVFPTMHTFFMNADNLFRADENIENIEVVRGGNSALFGSNTPGAIINFVNKTGGSQIGGVLRASGATGGLARYDLNLNGPLGEDWRFNIGGFYRYDRGVRDPGFPGIRGGQVKASITRLLTNGYVRVSGKFINDRNQFILPLPFQNPSDPEYVPGFSDYGSMSTNEGVGLRVPIPTGTLSLPLENGLQTQASWLTADIGFDFPDQWNIQNIAQVMSNDQEWNAIVPGDVFRAGDYLSGLRLPAGASAPRLVFTNHFDLAGNKLPYNTPNGLVAPSGLWHVEKPLSAFQNQLTIRKAFGQHRITAGIYFANYTQTNRWYFTDILMDVRDNPRFLDVLYTPAGGAAPANRTSNGFRNYLSLYRNGTGQTSVISGMLGAELQLTEKLRADLGVRWESDDFVQSAENTSTFDLDNDTTTVFDQENFGNGSFRHFDRKMNDWAASLGLNYRLTDEWSVYLQGSRAYKMPALDEFLEAQSVQKVELFDARQTYQAEAGVKFSTPPLGFAVNGFYVLLKNIIGQGLVTDPVTQLPIWLVTTSPENISYGGEVELSMIPVENLNILLNGTGLKAELGTGAGADIGSWINGVPSFIGNLLATYTVSGITLMGDFHYVARRYSDFRAGNVLPAYHYANFGLSYAFPGQGVTISASVQNAYQSKGLEEGNPRLVLVGGRTSDLFLARPILPRRASVDIRYQF